MLDYIKERISEKSSWLGLVSVISSGIMIFTPDSIDTIIEILLFAFGAGAIIKKEPVEEKKVVKKK